jgi:hypothetical protein
MQAGIYMKMYKCSDFKYCLFGAINTAYRVFMRVYNGLLPTASRASPKYNSKTSFCVYKQIYFTVLSSKLLSSVDKTSVSVSPAVSRQSFETFYRYILH